jgi:2'-5' RNA ligase
MTAVDKSASDKANPTGEARAAKLIAWFNAGAGGKIKWGTPGDFDACVRIAGKHMTPDQAKGFCALRHRDATGHRPGKAPAERKVHKAGRLALLRRLLSAHPATKTDCPSCGAQVSAFAGTCSECGAVVTAAAKAIDGARTFGERNELVGRALKLAYADTEDSTSYVWVQDLTEEWAVFELSGKTDDAGLYRVRYVVGADSDEVAFGEPQPVERRTEYVPKSATVEAPSVLRRYLDARREKALGMSTSAMVAFYPSPDVARALALPGGELPEAIHCTLGFLGSDAVVRLDRDRIEAALATFAASNAPVSGKVGGIARFNAEDGDPWPLVALVDAPGLTEFRQRLVGTLAAAGVEVSALHGYCAHMTLALVEPDDEPAAAAILAEGIDPTPLGFGTLVLKWGDDRTVFELAGADGGTPAVYKAVAGPVIKSVDAQRYTFAPLYPASPERPTAAHLDAHGDFATAEDLQKAVWDYVRAGDRSIRDQHRDGTEIGEAVEIVSWPYEVTVPMTKADGTVVEKSFAPGTVFLGVVWNETGWSDVVKGRKRGYSLGGMATRVDVEMA